MKLSGITRPTQTPKDLLIKERCEKEHLFFTRYFFSVRENGGKADETSSNRIKFRVNWHHHYLADLTDQIIDGSIKNLVINIAPGGSKTEQMVINFIARGLAINPHAKFLHISYSDDLTLLNSSRARDLVESDEFQEHWPLPVATDSRSKKQWNVIHNGHKAGGVYAVSLGGQITGFRAGRMVDGFQGAILIDDPLKVKGATSDAERNQANTDILATVNSRRANPDTPIVLIMQRLDVNDPTGFIKKGNLPGEWTFVEIPALIDDAYVATLPEKYQKMIQEMPKERDEKGRFSYWPYKERLSDLLQLEKGGTEKDGQIVSRRVFSSQYQQRPVIEGGGIIKSEYIKRYKVLPKILYKEIFADTAQKTEERHDYSVFECWGYGEDKRIYLIDLIRGKWEAPELKRRAIAFWAKHVYQSGPFEPALRKMWIEDKASGTGLVQEIQEDGAIPVEPIQRNKDKYTRWLDYEGYYEAGLVCVPEDAPFTNDYIAESEAFTADDTHEYDDQIDPTFDAIQKMLVEGRTFDESYWT